MTFQNDIEEKDFKLVQFEDLDKIIKDQYP